MSHKILCTGIVGLGILFTPTQHAFSEDDIYIRTIPNRSNRNLLLGRLSCAFGDMPAILQNIIKRGDRPPDLSKYCRGHIVESIKRGRGIELYLQMAGDDSTTEYRRIYDAAITNQRQYQNANGITKELPCSLAYDAGYVFESVNPLKAEIPTLSETQISNLRDDCLSQAMSTPSINGFIVGVSDNRSN